MDLLVTFEYNTGYSNYVADGWVTKHLARQFCHLPYATPDAATMTNLVNLAARRNAGWIFVTDDSSTNPWDTLPAYWTNEVNYVRSLNQAQPPTLVKLSGVHHGVASVQISGSPGTYELQSTSNFVNWSVAAIVSTATNQAGVTDASGTNAARRFYRTRQ